MTRDEKRTWWRGHIECWHESGQSQAAYCREHGLRACQFTYWKRRLESPTAQETSSLVPVRLVDESVPSATDAGVVVEFDGQVRLRLARGFDPQVLAEAVAALRRP